METKKLLVGAGREIITPPISTLLFGYRPDTVSTSVNDDLTVTSVMLEYGNTKAMLISIAVCLIQNALIDEIREKIEKETGVPKYNIIIGTTHTHSGPITAGMPGWGTLNSEYCDNIMIPQTIKSAVTAFNSRKPAKMGINTTHSDVGINRREIDKYGNILLGQNPWGPYDPIMTVINFRGLDGAPIINLIHYCCHGTASGCNHEITRDWSGPMIDRLEQQSGCMTVFFNGAEGDVGPRLSNNMTTGDITFAMELGGIAAVDAARAYFGIKEYRSDIDLKVIDADIKLPYKELLPFDVVESALAKYVDPEKTVNISYLEYKHLKDIYDFYKSGKSAPEYFTFRQTLIAFGPVIFVPFPFEIFVEVTLRLRHYSKYQYTLCLSNSNGANSYFPSQDQLCRGGYEVKTFIAGNTFTLTDDADNKIICANLDLMEELKCTE